MKSCLLIITYLMPGLLFAQALEGLPIQIDSITWESKSAEGDWYTSKLEDDSTDYCDKAYAYLQGQNLTVKLDYLLNGGAYPFEEDKIIRIKLCPNVEEYYKNNKFTNFKIQRRVETELTLSIFEGKEVDLELGRFSSGWHDLKNIDKYTFIDTSLNKAKRYLNLTGSEIIKRLIQKNPNLDYKDKYIKSEMENIKKSCPTVNHPKCRAIISFTNVEWRVVYEYDQVQMIIKTITGFEVNWD